MRSGFHYSRWREGSTEVPRSQNFNFWCSPTTDEWNTPQEKIVNPVPCNNLTHNPTPQYVLFRNPHWMSSTMNTNTQTIPPQVEKTHDCKTRCFPCLGSSWNAAITIQLSLLCRQKPGLLITLCRIDCVCDAECVCTREPPRGRGCVCACALLGAVGDFPWDRWDTNRALLLFLLFPLNPCSFLAEKWVCRCSWTPAVSHLLYFT